MEFIIKETSQFIALGVLSLLAIYGWHKAISEPIINWLDKKIEERKNC